MKLFRLASLLLVAGALPVAAIAATGKAGVAGVSGQVFVSTGDKPVALEAGQSIPEGATLETNGSSGVEVALPSGGKIVLGPSTRVRLKSLKQSESDASLFSYELVLLRGNVTGDTSGASPSSNFSIRTTAGTANVAGASFTSDFTPSTVTSGAFTVAAVKGNISMIPTGGTGPVSIPAGSKCTQGTGATSQVVALSASELTDILNVLTGASAGKVTSGVTISSGTIIKVNFNPTGGIGGLPDFSILVISPNGEGNI